MILRVFNYLILSAETTVPYEPGKVINGELVRIWKKTPWHI
jgi:hypothetical protein